MAYKTIGVSQEAYNILSRRKKRGMSFSNVILGMDSKLKEKTDVMQFAGILSRETALKVEDAIKKERRRAEIEAKLRQRSK